MINNERIVPITAIDLISMYGVILKNNPALNITGKIDANDTDGNFTLNTGGTYIASEPVKTLDIASTFSGTTVYFVPAYDFAGFLKDGVPSSTTPDGDPINADGRTLYKASINLGNVTSVLKVAF